MWLKQKLFKACGKSILIFSILFSIQCSGDPAGPTGGNQYSIPESINDGWETASLSSVGMDEELLLSLIENINSESGFVEVHSVLIIKDNKLVFEEYWPGHDFGYYRPNYLGTYTEFERDTRHNTHSATKSVVSALIGIAIDQGYIQSKDDSIFDYLPEYFDIWNNAGRENITIEDCLTMSSGLEWNEWEVSVSDAQHDIVIFNGHSSPITYLLNKPIVTEPGTSFYYNGGTVDLLGVIVANATGQSVQEFSTENLFGPLGITNYEWQTLYPSGITCCHGDIYITPRDLAKFGQLYLDSGVWNGQQIISTDWVNQSTQNHISPGVTWAAGYGYLWWLRNISVNGVVYESFKAIGWGGQEIFVFRELNLVVVMTGANYVNNVPCDNIVKYFILPTIL